MTKSRECTETTADDYATGELWSRDRSSLTKHPSNAILNLKDGDFMSVSKKLKLILFSLVYGVNLFFALCLWICGMNGDILFGIISIVFYRLSLWLAPLAVTVICWLPSKPKIQLRKKLLFYLAHLLLCCGLFLICYLLFGNWY